MVEWMLRVCIQCEIHKCEWQGNSEWVREREIWVESPLNGGWCCGCNDDYDDFG